MIALALALAVAGAAQPCPHDREALLGLDVETFDRTRDKGWRVLGEVVGCEAAGAELIAVYREKHRATLAAEEEQGLKWHEGQLRAAVGETDRAAILLEEARANDEQLEDRLYARATVAFLRRDRAALVVARRELAALPMPEGFAEAAARAKAKHNLDVQWPPNLDIVDGLIACFDRPYAEAYGGCEAASAP